MQMLRRTAAQHHRHALAANSLTRLPVPLPATPGHAPTCEVYPTLSGHTPTTQRRL